MPPAARIGDMVLQMAPHCHAPIHPPAPTPTPVPHPALPLNIIKGEFTVLVGGPPQARVSRAATEREPPRRSAVLASAIQSLPSALAGKRSFSLLDRTLTDLSLTAE